MMSTHMQEFETSDQLCESPKFEYFFYLTLKYSRKYSHDYAPHIGGYPPITPFPLNGARGAGVGWQPPMLALGRLTEAWCAHSVSTQLRGDHPSWADAKVRLGGGRVCWRKSFTTMMVLIIVEKLQSAVS